MDSFILINQTDFWEKLKDTIRPVVQEEMKVILSNIRTSEKEDLIMMDEACLLLHKTKQTIYNWLAEEKIKGYYIGESLFFFRSEIIQKVKEGKKEYNKDKNENS